MYKKSKSIKTLAFMLPTALLLSFSLTSCGDDNAAYEPTINANTQEEVITPNEASEETGTERTALFYEHLEWAISRIDVILEQFERDNIMMAILFISTVRDAIENSLDTIRQHQEIWIEIFALPGFLDFAVLPSLHDLASLDGYDDAYLLQMALEVIEEDLLETRANLEALR
ncbi:MAG: hypothetical protein FWF50_03995 [Defluviitaleaceae bacterium]|nr:hypothetical protein [Defluviitaleaceae bacterium]